MNMPNLTFNSRRPVAPCADTRLKRWALRVQCSAFLLLSLPLVAQSLSPGKDLPPLAPAYGELPATFWERHETAIFAAGMACLAFAGLFLKLWLRPETPPVLLPEMVARQESLALAGLRGRLEDGKLLSEVSQILRRYVVAAFGLPPAEMTTTDFCAALNKDEKIGPELAGMIAVFLRDCDARKFALNATGATFNAVDRALELISVAEQRRTNTNAPVGKLPK